MTEFLFYADESGHVTQDPGASDSSGPSRFLTFGGCLVRRAEVSAIDAALTELRAEFSKKKNLHATELSHVQKIYAIRRILKLNVQLFAVISDKKTLRGFKAYSERDSQKYYNRTALYLLSRLGSYLLGIGIRSEEVQILFEARHHDYARFRNYVSKTQRNPTGDEVEGIQGISAALIGTADKDREPKLFLADLVAHAAFCAFDRNRKNFSITEVRYLRELADGFCEDDLCERLRIIQSDKVKDLCPETEAFLLKNRLR